MSTPSHVDHSQASKVQDSCEMFSSYEVLNVVGDIAKGSTARFSSRKSHLMLLELKNN